MAVNRVGEPDDYTQKRLGKLLVTIDDLNALLDILSENQSNSRIVRPSVTFTGGSISEADDLRELSDTELLRIAIKTQSAQVFLDDDSAVIFGSSEICDRVYFSWARTRQTRGLPRSHPARRRVRTDIAFLVSLIALMSTYYLPISLEPVFTRPTPVGLIVTTSLASVLAIVIVLAILLRIRTAEFARIAPMSMNEYRQMQGNQLYPRRSWLVAIIATAIAAGALAATVIISIFGK